MANGAPEKFTEGSEKNRGIPLAFLGLGNMGSGVAARLCELGWEVTVHNRTASKTKPLVAAGATAAASPGDAVEGAEVVLVSLSDEAAVRDVVLGRAVPRMRPGTLVLDCSTVSPAFSDEVSSELRARNLVRVETCLVGNPFQARQGALRILAGGHADDVDRARPILDDIGGEVIHLGEAGSGATMKLVLNVLLGAQVASLAEAVNYGEAAGLDRDLVLDVVTSTTGFASQVMRFRAGFMRERRYHPAAFRTTLMNKDLRHAVEHAHQLGLDMPVVSRTRDSYAEAVTRGQGDEDAAVLLEHRSTP